MPRPTADHALMVKKAVLTVERSNNRSIGDQIHCLAVMQDERTDARLILNPEATTAMRLMADVLSKALDTQIALAGAHHALMGITELFDIPGFGASDCVPNEPGGKSIGSGQDLRIEA